MNGLRQAAEVMHHSWLTALSPGVASGGRPGCSCSGRRGSRCLRPRQRGQPGGQLGDGGWRQRACWWRPRRCRQGFLPGCRRMQWLMLAMCARTVTVQVLDTKVCLVPRPSKVQQGHCRPGPRCTTAGWPQRTTASHSNGCQPCQDHQQHAA